MKKVLFVCMGNICRSPTAEAVFRKLVSQAGQASDWLIDSAGTHAYHVGNPPDKRSQRAAKLRGYAMESIRARQVEAADFKRFDWIVAMDSSNHQLLAAQRPEAAVAQLDMMMNFASQEKWRGSDVPDPYYGGEDGFDEVIDRLEDSCRGFLRQHS